VPVAGRTDFDALKDAMREVWDYAGDRVTLAWTLIGGVNHGQDEVDALIAEFAGLPIRVNLIDLNRWDEADGQRRATDEERRELVGKLHAAGIATIRRYSGGQNRQAACGMLASTRLTTLPAAPSLASAPPPPSEPLHRP
jgi:23S rRNA (adenine2503-C2)-methyltransferase